MSNNRKTTYRAIDANLNRASEGVRTVEDILRFGHDAKRVAGALRAIRHDLRSAAELLPGGNAALVSARDSRRDVARNAPALETGAGAADPLAANLKRAQEASRVLEELSKPINAVASSMFGDIRFRLYDIEKDIAKVVARARRMPDAPFLYAVAGYEDLKGALTERLTRAGAGLIQLRDKDAADAVKLARAKSIRAKIKPGSSLFVVNDRVDIALASGADAAHLGAEDMPVDAARDIAGDSLLIGRSSNSYREAMTALEQRPDYLAVGAIFHSPTKPDRKRVGLKLLSRVAEAAGDTPVVAIGGINLGNIREVLDAGASGAAVVSAVTQAEDIGATLKRISAIFDDYRETKNRKG